MKLQDLKANAKKILEIPEVVGDFQNHSFTTTSGGVPENVANIPEVRRASKFEYRTSSNGPACSGETVVLCRDTGTKDANDRPIYLTPSGETFVYRYWGGSPSRFDGGALENPTFK